jgi:hypothetical protein
MSQTAGLRPFPVYAVDRRTPLHTGLIARTLQRQPGLRVSAPNEPSTGSSLASSSPPSTDLAELTPPRPPAPRPLTVAWRAYERQLTNLVRAAGLVA